jgi:hypothetical protein
MNAENKETCKKHDAGSCCSEQYAVPSELPLPLCSGSRYISSELACRTAAADFIILISADAVCNCKGNSAALPYHRLLRPSIRTFVLLTFCIISNIYSNVNESGRLFRTYFRYSVSYVLCRRGTHVPNIRLLFCRQARILRISCGYAVQSMG